MSRVLRICQIVMLMCWGMMDGAAAAKEGERKKIAIESMQLADALTEWALQFGVKTLLHVQQRREHLAPRVVGEFSSQEALDLLIAGSGLRSTWLSDRLVRFHEELPDKELSAQASSEKTLTVDTSLREALLLGSMDEVIVAGTHIRGSLEDIRVDGVLQVPATVALFRSKRVDEIGPTTMSDAIDYLPQQPYRRIGNSRGESQHVELRGLGLDTTLILINGRRAIPNSHGSFTSALDLNAIPYAAVESIEILSDSASAVYGADAIGGVVNLVLKKSQEPTVDIHYGTAKGGFDERRVSLSAGYSTERLTSSIVLEYFDRDSLLGSERELSNDQDYRRFGGRDWRAASSNPASVFAPTAISVHPQSLSRYRSIIPANQHRSVVAHLDGDLSSRSSVFAELLYADRGSSFLYEPALLSTVVPASNPHNPFHLPIKMDYLFTGLGPRQTITESELFRGVVGARGVLDSWDWELSLLRAGETGRTQTRNEVNTQKAFQSLASPDPELALNVFEAGAGGSPALLAWLREEPHYRYSSAGLQGLMLLRGPIATLPGGNVQVVLGGEWLDVTAVDAEMPLTRQRRAVLGAFTEARVPLVQETMAVPVVKELTLAIAARSDSYSDLGNAFNPQYGLVWRPVTDLTLRASFATSYRPPSLMELYAPRTRLSSIQVPDPLRNNEIAAVTLITGGNPRLNPTRAESFCAGLVFTPSVLAGLELSGTYWQIEMDRPVKVLGPNILISQQQIFAGRVVRDDPSDEDIKAGLPGALRSLDISRINFGKLDTQGVDLVAAYALDTSIGEFTPQLAATWVGKYETVDLPDPTPTDRVDVANAAGTIPRWRVMGTLGWRLRGVSLSAVVRYVPSYSDADSFTAKPNGRIVPSQTLVDVQAMLDLSEGLAGTPQWLRGLRLTVGVTNLFDQPAHFAEVGGASGMDPTQSDMRQRFGYVRLSARF